MLDSLGELNQRHFDEMGDPETKTTIAQQEMAFRMQTSVPELTDVSSESTETMEMYGPEVDQPGSYARNCLLARRMAERGVRFIQLFHRGWDHHTRLPENMRGQCEDVDQPTAALLHRLETAWPARGYACRVLWRIRSNCLWAKAISLQPIMVEIITPAASLHGWQAAAFVEVCSSVAQTTTATTSMKTPCTFGTYHATMLHLLGLNHEQLTFPYQGLDQKLTGVEECRVVDEIIS